MFKTYSIIIPHRNNPELLDRLLSTIPMREDIEIIVADDNSDMNKKPQVSRKDVRVIEIGPRETKGAGHARNVAMAEAIGEWYVFADSDDFFVEGFINVLDIYKNSSNDVIYYNYLRADAKSGKIIGRRQIVQDYISNYDGTEDSILLLKYKNHTPWSKMVRSSLVKEYKLHFEEVINGNDTLFSYFVGYFARNYEVVDKPIYVYTYNASGITYKKKTKNGHLCKLQNISKNNVWYDFIGKSEWKKSILYYFRYTYQIGGLFEFFRVIYYYYRYYQQIKLSKNLYKTEILQRNNGK